MYRSDAKAKQDILQVCGDNPEIILSRVVRKTGIPHSSMRDHLETLMKNDLITSVIKRSESTRGVNGKEDSTFYKTTERGFKALSVLKEMNFLVYGVGYE